MIMACVIKACWDQAFFMFNLRIKKPSVENVLSLKENVCMLDYLKSFSKSLF